MQLNFNTIGKIACLPRLSEPVDIMIWTAVIHQTLLGSSGLGIDRMPGTCRYSERSWFQIVFCSEQFLL